MTISELIEIAKETMIPWKSGPEAEEFILGLQKEGHTEAEIEKILYLMDSGYPAETAKQIIG